MAMVSTGHVRPVAPVGGACRRARRDDLAAAAGIRDGRRRRLQPVERVLTGAVYEAKAAIAVYSPWVSEGLNNGTTQLYGGSDVSEWVMLDQDPSTSSDGKGDTYFQAGWIEYYQGHRFDFAEIDVPGQPFSISLFNPDSINTTHWWDVQFSNQCEDPTTQPMYTYQQDNGQTYWFKPPSADYQFIRNQGQLASETHATADQESGGYDNHSWMGYLEVGTERNRSLHVGSTDVFPSYWGTW